MYNWEIAHMRRQAYPYSNQQVMPYPIYPPQQFQQNYPPPYVNELFDHPLYSLDTQKHQPYPGFYPAGPPNSNFKAPVKSNNLLTQSFKNDDGTFDLNKALDTAGMVMNTVNQFSGMVKGVGSIFKA